jgi:hypothetical protein
MCAPAEEAGTESHSLGTSSATKPGQTAGGARNAAQRRNRAFRHALVRIAVLTFELKLGENEQRIPGFLDSQ